MGEGGVDATQLEMFKFNELYKGKVEENVCFRFEVSILVHHISTSTWCRFEQKYRTSGTWQVQPKPMIFAEKYRVYGIFSHHHVLFLNPEMPGFNAIFNT